MNILVTGGLGYIGRHFVISALEQSHELTIIDNLSNSSLTTLQHLKDLSKKELRFYKIDIRDKALLDNLFSENTFDVVVHFAGLKSVKESCLKPALYIDNNVNGSQCLIDAMVKAKVNKFIFSSSATVYGQPEFLPYTEIHPCHPENPYGETKLEVERRLRKQCQKDSQWQAISLRYFNPIGAHPSGLLCENPKGTPDNLMPYIVNVAKRKAATLPIFGHDYPSADGTALRDYIHVMDLAQGHLQALDYLKAEKGFHPFNLGTGKACSVLELVQAFAKTNQVNIPYQFEPRRQGDIFAYWAATDKAEQKLKFKTHKSITDMVKDSWPQKKETHVVSN